MKRFDPVSIKNRMIQRLQVQEDWANILGVGVIGSLVDVISEGNAELVRYLEYLYNEKKWRNARNMSSLTHLADLISYKRSLPKSAIGHVIVSHTDINGVERLPNYGVNFFDLNQTSNFDDLVENERASFIESSALVPWTADDRYMIPKGTIFKSNTGVSYLALETVETRSLKEPFSRIRANPSKYEDFLRAGGWNGIKYLKVPVIQGEEVVIHFGRSRGTRFESFVIDSLTIENASNVISERFFKVEIQFPNTDITEEWEKIHNIRLAGPYDKVFEVKILNNEDRVLIKFGDGITGRMLPSNAELVVKYLNTMGSRGNIQERFQIISLNLPPNHRMIDPRTNQQSNFLNCTNISPIMGGFDIENEDEIRTSAPPSYLQSYTISTHRSYMEQILKNSPVNLLHCKIFYSGAYTTGSYGPKNVINDDGESNVVSASVLDNNRVLQEITMNKNTLLITAIRSNGEKIDDPETNLIEPIIKAFVDVKSPSDSFDYIEPNYIEIRPNILVNTNETLTEDEIQDKIVPHLLNRYNIFNTDFDQSYYKADIVDITQNSLVSTFPEIFLEAKANIGVPLLLTHRTDSSDIFGPENSKETLMAYPFNFDKIFAQNKLNAGFKNYKVKAPYLIRADLIFREDPTKNRSLFLFDERTDLQDEITVNEAEQYPINPAISIPGIRSMNRYENFGNDYIRFYNDYSESFFNQQTRTAQFTFIDKVTTPTYVYQMRQFGINPVEIRPLFLDEYGQNRIFETEEVTPSERLSLNFIEGDEPGQFCYRKNRQFVENCKILFYENYHNVLSPLYANGFIIIPLHKLFITEDILEFVDHFKEERSKVEMAKEIDFLLREKFTLNVYSIPMEENFHCENPFDIIFTSRDNLLLQKNYLKSSQ